MTEELNRKADRLSLAYKTKYSEDRTLKDMLSRPQAFVEGAVEGIINLLRQKAYRDGYIAGVTENGIIWHDMIKNPDDLPTDKYFKITSDGYIAFYDCFLGKWYDHRSDELTCQPAAWTEIPVFEE